MDILKTVILVVVVVIAVVTCPKEQAHKDKLAAELGRIFTDKITEESDDAVTNLIVSALAGETIDAFSGSFVDHYLEVDDYFIFSLGHYTINGEKNYCTFGCFGHVFCFSMDKIKKQIIDLINK